MVSKTVEELKAELDALEGKPASVPAATRITPEEYAIINVLFGSHMTDTEIGGQLRRTKDPEIARCARLALQLRHGLIKADTRPGPFMFDEILKRNTTA